MSRMRSNFESPNPFLCFDYDFYRVQSLRTGTTDSKNVHWLI